MNQRLWRIVSKTLFLSLLGVGFVVGEVWGQATFVSARHETLSQRQVDVTFNQAVTAGAPSTAGWTVTVNGTAVPFTNLGNFGPNTVRIEFDASAIAGHTVGQNFLKPGEVLRVRYNGTGAMTSAGGVSDTGLQVSQNNTPFTCTEMEFFQQGNFTSVDVCSPVVMNFRQYQYRTSLKFRNSSLFNLTNFRTNIQWGDATTTLGIAFYVSDLIGNSDVTFIDNTGFTGGNPGIILTQRPTKNYPAANPTDCSFDANILPLYNGVAFCPSISTTTIFPTYDTDNANSGALALQPSPLPTSNQVCLGTNVGMQFSDATLLNCRAAIEPIVPNEGNRHIRVVYGSTNFGAPGNIPDIRVTLPAVLGGGTTQVTNNNATGTLISGAFTPTSVGVADFNGVIPVSAPVTAATALTYMGTITTTLTNNQAVGQRFYVRLDYWDVCNPYNPGNPANPAPVSIENFVVIVDAPPIPVVAYTQDHCDTDANNTFTITATRTQASSTLRWYRDAALTDLEKSSTTSATFNPITEGSPALNKATTSAERIINYYVTEQWATGLNCTSPVQTITFRITDTNNGGVIDHPDEIGTSQVVAICTGDNPPAFTNTTSASGGDGSNYTYQWQQSTAGAGGPFVAASGTNNNLTYDPPVLTQNTWYRRRVSSGYCGDAFSNVFMIRVDVAVTGGSIGNAQTICTGGNPAALTNTGAPTGGSGSYSFLWQQATAVGGPYTPASGTNDQITYDPPVLTQTTFYRRFVSSGVCAANTALSNVIEVTVDQVVVPGVVNNPQTICSGADPAILGETTPPSGGNGSTYTFQWQESATGGGAGFAAAPGINNNATYDPPVLTATRFYRRRVTSGVCAATFSNEIQITVNPLPTAPNPTGGGAVCAGNPAPDIVWTGLTGTAPFTITYTIAGVPQAPVVEPTTTFAISNPLAPGAYQITSLQDNNGCFGTSLGGSVSVTVGGNPPLTDSPFVLNPSVTCDAGGATTDPQLNFSLDPASTVAGTYVLTYRVNGGANQTKNFTVNLANGDPSAISFSEVALNAVATHTIRVVSIVTPLGCQTTFNTDLSFTVRALPSITTQPTNTAICDGGNASFTVVGAGTDLGFQWQEQVGGVGPFNNVSNGGVYSGATSATLTLTAAPIAMHSNRYRVVVSGFNPPSTPPICTTTSASATLTVNAFANISAQPANATRCVGQSVSFSVTATGPGGPAFLWEQDPDGAGPMPFAALANGTVAGVTYSGVTTATLTLTSLTGALNGSIYRVRTRTTGTCDLYSNNATLTVNPLPVVNNLTPTLCEDQPGGSGTASNIDLPLLYDAAVMGGTPPNTSVQYFTNAARTAGFLISAPINIFNTQTIFTRVTNSSTTCISDGTLVFTVRALPARANQMVQICEDTPPGSLAATGINLQSFETAIAGGSMVNRDVEWYENAALTILIPPGAAVGAEQNYSINADKQIHAKIIDTSSPTVPPCFSQATLDLDYQARPNDNQITDGIGQVLGATYTVCASSNLVLLQINPTLNPGSTYTWTVPPVSYPGEFELLTGTTGFFIILRFPNPIPGGGTIYPTGLPISVKETLGSALCDGNTINTRIVVEGSPPKPIIAGPTSVCSGANGLVYSVTNPVAGSYSWTLPPGATITSLPVTASTITVQMSSFSGNVNVTHASGTGCTSPAADPLGVSVVARPSITSASSNTICSGQNVSAVHTLTSTIAGTTYNWQVINVTGFVSGTLLGDFANGVASINQTLTNTSGVTASVTYQVTPVGPGPDNCLGNPQNLTITVNPQPVIVAGQNKTVCSGAPANLKVLLSPAGLPATTTFSWPLPTMSDLSVQGSTGSGVLQGDAVHITDAFVNTSSTSITATYNITPVTATGCTGAMETVVITINPQPVGADITRAAQCSNVAFSVSADNITNGVAGSTFTWVRNALPAGLTQVTGGSGTGPIAETLRNQTGGQLNATYVVTPTSGAGCTGATYVVTVPVNPEPVGAAITRAAQCSDVAFSVSADNITNGVAGTTFTWTRNSLPAGLTQVAAGTGVGPIAETLRNQTSGQLSATYVVTPTSGAGCVGATYVVTVPINPEPVGAAITRAPQCSKVGFSVSADNITNGVAGVTFSWVRNPLPAGLNQVVAGTGTGPIAETLENLTGGQLNATYVVTPTSGAGCIGATYVVTVPVNPEPVGAAITRAAQCSNVGFSVSADNITNGVVGSTFTWVRDPLPVGLTQVAAGTGTGAIAETLRNLTGGQLNATYVVTPTSGAGCVGATYVVTVPINPEPVGSAITRAPQCSNIGFSVSADNITNGVAGVTFTWVRNPLPVGLTPVSAGSGVGPIAETLRNITSAQLSASYVVTPTSGAGCIGATYVVTVPVDPEPVGAAVTRAVQCSNVPFSVSADNITNGVVGSTFTWVRNALPPGLTQIAAGTGVGPIAETLGNVTGGQLSATYTVTPTSGAGCVGATYVITVPVNPEPVGANITRAAQCSNSAFSVSADNITNGVAGVTFTWVRNPLPVGLTQVTAGTGTGPIAETLRNQTGGQLSATYVVTPTSGASCVGATYEVTVPINPEPVGAAITRPAQCSNVAYSLSADNITNGVAGVTFTWTRNPLPAGLTPVTAGSGVGPIAETLRNQTGGQLNATYVVTPTSGVGCVGASYVVTVPVDPEPVGAAITRAAQCSEVAFSVSADNITNGVVGSTFTWVRNALPAGLTQVVAGTGAGPIAETLRNLTGGQLNATYIVTPTSGAGCLGATYVVTVPVNPQPVGADVTRSAQCSNVGFSVSSDNITNGVAGVTFTWVRDPLPPGLNQVVAGSGVGPIAETLSNITSSQLSATYTVTPTSGAGCLGATYVVTVPINPEPVGVDITRAAQCSNVAFSLSPDNVTNGVAGSTFTWVRNALPVGLTQVVGGTGVGAIAETLRNLTSGQLNATYTVTPTSGVGCVGATYVVTVPVNPEPVGAAITRAPQCSNVGFSLSADNITNGVAGVTFSWVRNPLPAGLTQIVAGTGVGPIAETLRNLTSAQLSATYTVTPTSGAGCVGATYIVTVPVNPEPVGADVTRTAQCSNVGFSLSADNITNGVAGVTFSWVRNALPVGLTQVTAGTGTGPIAETLQNLTGGQLSASYTVTPTSGAGCVGASYVITIPVNPEPIGADITRAPQCSNLPFSVSANNITNGVVGSTFTWVRNPLPVGLTQVAAGSGSGAIAETLRNQTGGQLSATYVVTPTSGAGCLGIPYVVTVPINPEPVAQAISTIERCSGDPIAFNIQDIINNVAPFAGGNSVTSRFSYSVVADFPLEVSPAVFPGIFDRVVATNAPIGETFSNFSYRDVTLTYTITPISDPENCAGVPFTLKVIIHPEPVGSNVIDPVCSTSLNHNLQSQITNPVPGLPSLFTYTFTPDPGNPTVVPLPPAVAPYNRTVASNANITDQFSNTTGSPATVTYTITPFNAANPTCAGTPFTYQVIISPNPSGVSDTKTAKCSDVPFVEDPQNNIVPAVASTFTWTATYDFGLTGGLGSGTGVIAETLHNETAGQLFAHYTVIPTAGTCVGAAFFIDIPVDAEPVMLPGLANPPAVCSTNAVSTNPIGVILETNGVSVAADAYIVSIKSVDAGLIPSGGNQALPNTFTANSPSAGQSDAISNDTYRNTTSAQLKVVYTVIPVSADGCQGNAFDITVPINPEPVLSTPVWPDVCSSNTGVSNPVNIVLGTNGTSANAVSYQLIDRQYSNGGPFGPALPLAFTPDAGNAVIMAAPGSINLIKNDKFNNKSTVAVTVRYTIQGFSAQGCVSEPLNYSVVVNPEPDLFVPAPGLVCSDVITGITLTQIAGSATATTFHINNIIRQAGLIAGGSNASIGLNQPNNAIFNDIFTNTTASPLTVTYKIAPVTAAGCAGAQKDIVITITPAPAVASNLNRTVCSDAPASIVLATEPSSAAAGSYRIDNITLGGAPGALIPNGTVNMTVPRTTANLNEISGDRFVNTTNNPLTVTYRITAIGNAAPFCEGPFRDVVLTVEPTIVATPNNINANICSATPTDIELLSPSMPTAGAITYNYIAVSSIGGQMTGFIPALNNLPVGYHITDNLVNNSNSAATVTYTITAVANGAASSAGCSSVGVPIVVNVEPKPKLVASPLVQTVCESDGVNVSPTNILLTTTTVPSVGTVEFQLVGVPFATGGMTLQPASMPLKTVYLNGETIADQWNNPTLSDQTVTYTLQPVVNGGLGCPGDNVVVTITVKPRPIISPVAPLEVCSSEFLQVPLVMDVPLSFATWTVSAPPSISVASSGQGDLINIFAINNGFNIETVTYTVTPKANNCNGIPITFDVLVYPKPDMVGLPQVITVCDGGNLNIPLTSSATGVTFEWIVDDSGATAGTSGYSDGVGTTINHTLVNTSGSTSFLNYDVTPIGPTGCRGFTRTMQVKIESILADFDLSPVAICSGQRIQITNLTVGATSQRWFYTVQGSGVEEGVQTSFTPNYTLVNNTTSNPLIYEIHFEPKNGLCTVPVPPKLVSVYRPSTAGFNEGTVPPLVGGQSIVNFTNTSTAIDESQFDYVWTFGNNPSIVSPLTSNQAIPDPVTFKQQGSHFVSLQVTNKLDNSCTSLFSKTIIVPVLPLVAEFELDPPAACFPETVKVISNNSTGNVMEWQVFDSNGLVATSGLDLPEFSIQAAGLYTVSLTTSDSFIPGISATAQKTFEIYDKPIASFQARPATVFVPDTELTTFNFSTKANFYQWDFGDGETSDEREPKHVYKIEGVYDIVLVAGFDHDNGVVCTDTLSQKVIAKQGGITRVPNAFTPNPAGPSGGLGGGGTGSGGAGTFNDVFLPIVKGVEEFNMQIFDRWGNLIFESNNANQGWDGYDRNGRILPAGVYVYKLTLRLSDGQRTTQIGDITMIR